MSSESLTGDIKSFMLSTPDDNYLLAKYYIETTQDPTRAAVSIAKEQTSAHWNLTNDPIYGLAHHGAKVVSVKVLGTTQNTSFTPYTIKTTVYKEAIRQSITRANVVIAYPLANFGISITNILNFTTGETARLGFITACKLLNITFPKNHLKHFEGPRYGLEGIQKKIGITRPILCRSARPAVGMTTKEMAHIAEQTLMGGFDCYKDDELTCDTPRSPFKQRVEELVAMKSRVEDKTGEKKLYFANIIEDHEKSLELYDHAISAGVDGVIVSPILNGLSMLQTIRRRGHLAIFAHSTGMEFSTRHPTCGISYDLYMKLFRIAGADVQITPGHFSTLAMTPEETSAIIESASGKLDHIKPSLPVIAGGKQPTEIEQYTKLFGSSGYMIIAATALDDHPHGITAGAKAFRLAWTAHEKGIALKEFSKNHPELSSILT